MPEVKQTPGPPSFGSLKAFELIGRLGGIRKAALALGVDHAAVSRHLKSLEQWAGTPLLDRSRGENGRLTAKGQRYHLRISAALCEIDNAGADLTQPAGAGHLQVWCSPGLAYKWLLPRFKQFTDAHGDMRVDLRIIDSDPDISRAETAARLEFIGDWLPWDAVPGIRTVEISRPSMIPVVSPSFLAAVGELEHLEDMLRLPLLHEESEEHWRSWFGHQGLVPSEIGGRRLCHANLTIDAAKRGHGVALAAELLVADEMRLGELVELSVTGQRRQRTHVGSFSLAARADRWATPAIARLRDWLRTTMQLDDASSRR